MTTFRALTISTDGTVALQHWDGASGTLTHLQKGVDGYVDVVALTSTLDMWLNDEGLILGLPINPVATMLAHQLGTGHQAFAGTAVLTGGADDEGITQALTDQQIHDLTRRCTHLATVL